ncbi:MAG: GGDEF domain-containing protein, partial [Magnetococcales bacterium]|nr:GGDEF domain-containing protein [Magnetococcales bacterium]
QIAHGLNQLMGHFQDNLELLCRDVGKVLKYDTTQRTNLLATTTEMVENLVEVAHFKQSIEEDHTKREVYARLVRLINQRFHFTEFSFYEMITGKNHLKVVAINGELDGHCTWCDHQILFQADSCRALRTGHPIDSFESPFVCGLFQRHEGTLDREHYCIPIIHSGAVGNILQLVVERKDRAILEKNLPYIRVYLREAAPMLEAKRLLDTLRESALRDPLTGLHNRRFLEEYMDTLVAISRRKKQKISIMMMDLDHFKQVNDTYGHEAGDTVLKSLARVLEQQLRASDLVIRYGGEEFMVVLQETDGYSGMRVAEKIRQAVEGMAIPVAGEVLHKTISIGVAFFDGDSGLEFWDVAKQADTALYQAKANGRNRVVCYEG